MVLPSADDKVVMGGIESPADTSSGIKNEAVLGQRELDGPAPYAGPNGAGITTTSTGTAAVTAYEQRAAGRFAYFKTRNFYIVLVLGQVLSLCITGTNTFSGLLAQEGNSIPAFQTFFNYVLLNLVYTSYTLYKYGFKGYARFLLKDGWKYVILSFFDVEGNYFVVLAYRYTTILSTQLINYWPIVVVVILSFLVLKVHYHWSQVLGIIICVSGMGLLIASDHITGANDTLALDQLKGDLFMLLGSSCYGFSNVIEEFLVSERPLYETVGQIGFWGMIINGAQAGIFDRESFQTAVWDGNVAGYLVGYTLLLFTFYSLAPIMFRMSSAAFFNISLLTGTFWGVVIGVRVFGLTIHFLYPIAFVLILVGLIVYFVMLSVLGESKKPWLGENQERGIDGIGTAKRRVEHPDAIV
ncbi:MAG: hypothetical protein M1829_002062 [Trizodia sp. TS-e1964]|nr:MAG: hypothetical protein M1829_002062 [Trizodia sp. TS-e1964]